MELAMEEQTTKTKVASWHLWAVGGLTLIWSLYGASRFLALKFGLFLDSGYASAELAHYASFPLWASAFWALTIWGSVTGAALLLLRSSWAVQSFVIAVFGLIGTSLYQFVFASEAANIYAMPIALATWIITIVALLFTSMAREAGQLR